jgi:hypothetical protein
MDTLYIKCLFTAVRRGHGGQIKMKTRRDKNEKVTSVVIKYTNTVEEKMMICNVAEEDKWNT